MQAADGARRGGGEAEAAVGQERRGRRGHVMSTRRRGEVVGARNSPSLFSIVCLDGEVWSGGWWTRKGKVREERGKGGKRVACLDSGLMDEGGVKENGTGR